MNDERDGGGAGKAEPGSDSQPLPSYQEGSVESVGGRPSGKDESDRSGDGTAPVDNPSPAEGGRDAFVSSEVSDKSSRPGKDPRTRS
jgi:hypothetical protein